jgi:hypothetical protein
MENEITLCSRCYYELKYSENSYADKFLDICEFYLKNGKPYLETDYSHWSLKQIEFLEKIKRAIVTTEIHCDEHMLLIKPSGYSKKGFCFNDH